MQLFKFSLYFIDPGKIVLNNEKTSFLPNSSPRFGYIGAKRGIIKVWARLAAGRRDIRVKRWTSIG
jgi:hypothetical protein